MVRKKVSHLVISITCLERENNNNTHSQIFVFRDIIVVVFPLQSHANREYLDFAD